MASCPRENEPVELEGLSMHDSIGLKMKEALQSPEGKRQFNEAHFAVASTKYDFATQALSLGRDVHWKDELIGLLPEIAAPMCLDLACGTGDLTFRLAERYSKGQVIGLDLTGAMIDRARVRNTYPNIQFAVKDMCRTGLDDNSVDIITGAYALRNAPDINQALAEIHRVMKPGGTAAFLDFAKPKHPARQALNYALLKVWGSFWGWMLHRDTNVHGYISESLKTFPHREGLRQRILEQGFEQFRSRSHFLGMVEVLLFRKRA
jgi:demethylmenaquinone methyltransferase/2-methoxy-6-polyprenyl-1,4-benzoquinol methylase